mmetsp:Transcript_26634/g.37496  ORF Transcript_26634/g.37496 Transcript_26634/m.37496 type:complete len:484 (+) Transcript_26634:159-1610(+)
MENKPYDVVIVGAGVVGASLAYSLGKTSPDRKILVIERDLREPDRIVGELLQPGGCEKLKELGLGECLEGIDAVEVHGYAVVMNNKQDAYPELQNKQENQRLVYPQKDGHAMIGKSFHHGRFVQNLRKAAQSVSNVEMVQGTVTQLIEERDTVVGVTWKDADGQIKNSYGLLNIVCDGCTSNFRSKIGAGEPSSTSFFVGYVLEDCKLPFPGYGHVFLGTPGPVLGYQIGSNEIRVLIDVPKPLPNSANGELAEFFLSVTAQQLPDEIRPAFIEAVKTKRPRSMANNRLHPQDSILKPGFVMVGDIWNMRHPLTGGGMTVAFNDVVLVRDALRDLSDLSDRKKVMSKLHNTYVVGRRPFASTINILAGALYNVFVASADPVLPVMRIACLDYFKLGGSAVSGPMSLLGGYSGKPYVLLYHFFCVALYGVWKLLKPFPSPSKLIQSYRLLAAASWIVIPLMRGEHMFTKFARLLSILFFLNRPR